MMVIRNICNVIVNYIVLRIDVDYIVNAQMFMHSTLNLQKNGIYSTYKK